MVTTAESTSADVVHMPGLLGPEMRARLRDRLGAALSQRPEPLASFGSGTPSRAAYQLDLEAPCLSTLRGLVGAEPVCQMWHRLRGLPIAHDDGRLGDAPPWGSSDAVAYMRRYSPGCKANCAPHADDSGYTVNVLLSDPGDFRGGDLVAFLDGAGAVLAREAGDGVAHGPNVMHKVDRLVSGERDVLVVMFFKLAEGDRVAYPERPKS